MFKFFRNIILPFLITFIFLLQALRDIDYSFFLYNISLINPIKVLLSLVILFVCHSIRVLRWKIILYSHESNLSFWDCFKPYFISLSLNNILPLRTGDIYRCLYFRKKTIKVNGARVLGSLLIEKIFDVVTILLFFFFGYYLVILNGRSFLLDINFIYLILLILIFLIFIVLSRKFKEKIFDFLGNFSFLRKLINKLIFSCENIIHLVEELFNKGKLIKVTILTIFSWSLEGLFFLTIIDDKINILTNWFGSWFVMAFATLSTLIPSSPGYVGTFHFFTKKGLEAYGMNPSLSTFYSFLIHASLWIPLTFFGISLFFIYKFKKALNGM